MKRKANASDGAMGTDDDDFMRRNRRKIKVSFKLYLFQSVLCSGSPIYVYCPSFGRL